MRLNLWIESIYYQKLQKQTGSSIDNRWLRSSSIIIISPHSPVQLVAFSIKSNMIIYIFFTHKLNVMLYTLCRLTIFIEIDRKRERERVLSFRQVIRLKINVPRRDSLQLCFYILFKSEWIFRSDSVLFHSI
jgi:hypothetical protein